MKKNKNFFKLTALTLSLSFSLSSITYANSAIDLVPINISTNLTNIALSSGEAITQIDVNEQINKAISYYSSKNYNILPNYEVTLAYLSANENLNGYSLPDTRNFTSTYVSSIASQIILLDALNLDPKNTPNNRNLVDELLSNYDGNGKFGYFDYGLYDQALSMIALNTINYNYDKETVLNALVQYYEQNNYGKNAFSFSDSDSAGKIIIALTPLKDEYEQATYLINGAVEYLKSVQLDNGGFAGYSNACSTATAISGLVSANVDITSQEFTKNGNNPITALLAFQNSDGGFASNLGEKNDDMFTFQQALMALGDYSNKRSIYTAINPTTYVVTKSDLLTIINLADAINKSSYTTNSYNAMETELIIAKEIYNNSSATTLEITEQASLLRATLKNLVQSSTDGGNSNNTITVSQTISTSNGITILSNRNYTIANNDTVFNVLKTSLNDANISLKYSNSSGGIYISSIGGYEEFEEGVNSGFEYYVNDVKPSIPCDKYYLNNGDTIKWVYTTDYTIPNDNNIGTTTTISKTDITSLNSYKKINSSINIDYLNNIYISYLLKDELSTFEKIFIKLYSKNDYEPIIESLINEVVETNGEYNKPTDLAKICLALKLYNQDLEDVGTVPLYSKLKNYKNLGKQGVNGYIFALMVATAEEDTVFANSLIENILEYQNTDGGFSLDLNDPSELDITSMALQALYLHKDNDEVKTSIENALIYLSENINTELNSENISQLIIALTLLNIDINDENFISEDKNLLERLEEFRLNDDTFSHTLDNKVSDDISTEQASLALVLLKNNYENIENNENVILIDETELTRLDFILLMYDVFEIELSEKTNNVFYDLDEDTISTAIINDFYNKGIVSGSYNYDNLLVFNPDSLITKEDAIVFLSRYLNIKEKFPILQINDYEQISDYAKNYVKNYISNDKSLLDENNNFNPKNIVQKGTSTQYLKTLTK